MSMRVMCACLLLSCTAVAQKKKVSPGNSAVYNTTTARTVSAYANVDAIMAGFPDQRGESTNEISDFIDHHFHNDSLKLRAVFDWVTRHVDYDVNGASYRSAYKTQAGTVSYVMSYRKGVCQGYATLFVQLCNELNIPAQMVSGVAYSPGNDSNNGHAWVAAQVQQQWWLFDPTWGAGYVQHGQFVRSINYDHFHPDPKVFVTDHMPCDPMWQLISRPLSYNAFDNWQEGTPIRPGNYNYNAAIAQYLSLSPMEQSMAMLRRMEGNGTMQGEILSKYKLAKSNLAVDRHNIASDRYNQAVTLARQADSLLTQYERGHLTNLLQSADTRLKSALQVGQQVDYQEIDPSYQASFKQYTQYVQEKLNTQRARVSRG